MIVRQFLFWLRSAPAGERAEATAALARAYLYSDLSRDDLAAAEGAMTMLLDDPSPLVRAAMAEVLAASEYAPPSVIHVLAGDKPDISSVILERSPLLLDAELVDAVATQGPIAQVAIARRARLPRSIAAAIAEIGTAEACLELVENPGADIAPFSIDRVVDRFGHLAPIREALLTRRNISASVRQALVAKLSKTLAEFVIGRGWLDEDRALRIAKEACEKATVALAAATTKNDVLPLIRHLRQSGQLTAGLILRALLSGNMTMFQQALADLSGMSLARVSALIHDRGGSGLRALYSKAGLPVSAYPAFHEAIATLNEDGFLGDPAGASRLKRRMVERVLTRCAGLDSQDIEPLLLLLRRFATEAAREEARMFCDDLVDGMMSEQAAWHDNADWQDNVAYSADDLYAGHESTGYQTAAYETPAYEATQQYGSVSYADAAYNDATAVHDVSGYDATAYEAVAEGYGEYAAERVYADEAGLGDIEADPEAVAYGAPDRANAWYSGANDDGAVYEDTAYRHVHHDSVEAGNWDDASADLDAAYRRLHYSNTNDLVSFDDVWDGAQPATTAEEWDDNNSSRYAA